MRDDYEYVSETDPADRSWMTLYPDGSQDLFCFDRPEELACEAADLDLEEWTELCEQEENKLLLEFLENASGEDRSSYAVKRYFDSGNQFQRDIDHTPAGLGERTTARLVDKSVRGDREARNHLAENNVRLLYGVVRRDYPKQHLGFDDQVQNGAIGLMRGLEKYDSQKGKLLTYLGIFIKGFCLTAVNDEEREIRLPEHICRGIKPIQREHTRLLRETPNIPPTAKELKSTVQQLGVSSEEVDVYYDLPIADLNLEEAAHIECETDDIAKLIDRIADKQFIVGCFEKYLDVYKTGTAKKQTRAVKGLSIISMRLGLLDGNARTLKNIGRIFGVSSERIRQVEYFTLKNLSLIEAIAVQERAQQDRAAKQKQADIESREAIRAAFWKDPSKYFDTIHALPEVLQPMAVEYKHRHQEDRDALRTTEMV